MKKFLLLFFIFCSVKKGNTQNLVGNFSFEDTTQCPDAIDQVPRASGWENWCLTPDYYNSCAPAIGPNWISVPHNLPNNENYQQAYSGIAYCGFFGYWPVGIAEANIRELIARKLDSTLQIGEKYFVSIEVSLALTSGQNCACNNLGVKFTMNSYAQYGTDSLTSPLINNYAQVYSSQIITDTVNWTKISGSFIADSTYQYVVIGNFFTYDHCDTMLWGSYPKCYAYYMVDEVYVSQDSLETSLPIFDGEIDVSIFPVPTKNILFLQTSQSFRNLQPATITIFNSKGMIVKTIQSKMQSQSIDVSDLSSSIYQMQLQTENKIFCRRFLKQ